MLGLSADWPSRLLGTAQPLLAAEHEPKRTDEDEVLDRQSVVMCGYVHLRLLLCRRRPAARSNYSHCNDPWMRGKRYAWDATH
jgi:hypothetical protein